MPRINHPMSILWLLLSLGACSFTPTPSALKEPQPHFGEDWYAYRARGLGLTAAQAKARDAHISETIPPDVWDEQVATEAAVLWASQCAACHGPRGKLEGVPPMEPQPRAWGGIGAQMGFFFGGDKMRAGIYRKIRDGGDPRDGKPSLMPAWGDKLSREQMWGLVYFIESL